MITLKTVSGAVSIGLPGVRNWSLSTGEGSDTAGNGGPISLVATLSGYGALGLAGILANKHPEFSEPLYILGVGGIFIGPSAGQFHEGRWEYGMALTGVRVFGAMVAVVGVADLLIRGGCSDAMQGEGSCGLPAYNPMPGDALVTAGLVLFTASTVYDIVDSWRSPGRRAASLVFAPSLINAAGRDVPGIGLAGRF